MEKLKPFLEFAESKYLNQDVLGAPRASTVGEEMSYLNIISEVITVRHLMLIGLISFLNYTTFY